MQASPPSCEATRDSRRSRTGSARALSRGATCLACSIDSGWEVSGEQQATVSAGLVSTRELDTHLY